MEGLAESVRRRVLLTSESQHGDVWLTFDPATNAWAKCGMYQRRDDELEPLAHDIAER